MKINFEENQTAFKADVSQRFVNSMRGFVNNGSDRLKRNYLLTQKIEQYKTYGYNNYTIEMNQRSGPLGFEYVLSAVKRDGNKRVILGIRDSYLKIFQRFMTYSKHDFCAKMYAKTKER